MKQTQKTQKSHDSQMSQTRTDPRDIGEHKRKESKGNLRADEIAQVHPTQETRESKRNLCTDEIAQPTQLLQLPHKLLPEGDIQGDHF